jgi:N-acetylmuramidase
VRSFTTVVTGAATALSSASWGAFQIMGNNYAMTGASSVTDFVQDEYASEGNQLRHFEAFVKAAGLTGALRDHDWARFARGYNGPGYQVNNYDSNMAAAYARRGGR